MGDLMRRAYDVSIIILAGFECPTERHRHYNSAKASAESPSENLHQ
jgi:hypothetical protein